MDALTLDQFLVFVAVVDDGGFSATARRLNRAPSAITYAIQKLEEQVGAALFDRNAYRPTLSEAGRILLPQARRILEAVGRFRASAKQIARGLEAQVRLVMSSSVSPTLLTPALMAFRDAFPTVAVRVIVLPFSFDIGPDAPGAAPGTADLRILPDFVLPETLEYRPLAQISLVRVAAASHPLSLVDQPLDEHVLRDHLQILLSEIREAVPGQERRVLALNTWRVTDPAALQVMIRAGIGWGSLPDAQVADDLATGRLVSLSIKGEGQSPSLRLGVVIAYRKDEPPGPAGRWLFDRLSAEGPAR